MIRQHPYRVLGATSLLAVLFLALSFPGRNDTSGAWYYISAVGWFGFMITVLLLLVLLVLAVVSRRGRAHDRLSS